MTADDLDTAARDERGRRLTSTGRLVRSYRADNERSITTRYTPMDVRFWAKVEKASPDDCWLWKGKKQASGYGRFTTSDQRQISAHRIAWELTNGPIPEGLTIDHVRERGCTSRLCCNPAHMEPVSRGENSRRAARAKTHCINGHEFTEENTRWNKPRYPNGEPTRGCRACARERWRSRNAA